MARENLLARTFVELADTLVDSYDLLDFLHLLADRCVELLGVTEAGVMLADPTGALRVMASSSERMRAMELFEVQNENGPCLDAWVTQAAVAEHDLPGAGIARWPKFAPMAIEAGFSSVYALPMRLRDTCIGALNLFAEQPGGLRADDALLGQALADVASIGIIQARLVREQQVLAEQLTTALTNRVVIEQAKGRISQQAGVDVDEAFNRIRAHARRHNRRLLDVATDIAQRRLSAEALLAPADSPARVRDGA